MWKKFIVALALLGAAALAWRFAGLPTEGKAAPAADNNPFRDKLVWVQTHNSVVGTMLEQAEVKEFGGQKFLVGKDIRNLSVNSLHSGRRVWTAFASIEQLVEFGSVEEGKKAMEELQKELAPGGVPLLPAPPGQPQ
jgi:hypothetical protein